MFYKKCVLGDSELDISTNTVVELRNATKQEIEEFAHKNRDKYWQASKPPYNEAFWRSLCSLLNGLKEYFLNLFNHHKDINRYSVMSRIESKFDIDGSINRFLLDNNKSRIKIESKFETKEEKMDEFGFPITDENGNTEYTYRRWRSTNSCEYPQDYWELLRIVGDFIFDDFKNIYIGDEAPDNFNEKGLKKGNRLDMTEEQLDEERIKLQIIARCRLALIKVDRKCRNTVRLLEFFRNNASYIAKFGVSAITCKRTLAKRDDFLNSSHRVLDVDGNIFFEYENDCGFDLDNKFSEIKKIQEKILNTMDSGEKNVEYTLRWILHNTDSYIVPIQKDCESKYRYNCILLRKSDFIDEPQEYDHILVSPAGIILIESKYWNGLVRYLPDGQLLRKVDGGDFCGENDTISQINRHMILMKQIAPNIPVYNVLCLAHNNVIIEGREFCDNFSIVSVNQLGQFIHKLCCDNRRYSNDQIDEIAKLINTYKSGIFL